MFTKRLRALERQAVSPTRLVIGIDQSLTGLGLVVLEPRYYGLVDHYAWTTKKALQARHPRALCYYKLLENSEAYQQLRLRVLMDWVATQITGHASEFDLDLGSVAVALEGYAYSKNSRGASALYELGGALKQYLWINRIPFRVYTPTVLKLHGACAGNATKDDMVQAAERMFSLNLAQYETAADNVADALWLADLLSMELEVKAGRMLLEECHETTRQALIRTSRSNPVAVISQPLVHADEVERMVEPVYAKEG